MEKLFNDPQSLYAKYETAETERTLSFAEILKKALLLYGVARGSIVSAIIMLLTHNLTAYNAQLRGIPYPIGQVIIAFVEFAIIFAIPFAIMGYFRLRNQTVTETVACQTPESDYLWDYEGWK